MSQDFSKGKIYKITNDYNDEVYVGSTCDTLVKRFSIHKCLINHPQKVGQSLSILMREIGINRFRIELIENYPCEDKYQLRQREGYWIRQIGSLNHIIAGRTQEEYSKQCKDVRKKYYEDNKEKCKEWNKKNEQKENVKATRQKYRENVSKQLCICECGSEITKHSLSRHLRSKKHLKLMNANNEV